MKRLILTILLILSVCPLAIAQHLQKLSNEELEYELFLSPLAQPMDIFGLKGFWSNNLSGKVGQATLSCQSDTAGGYILCFHGYGKTLGKEVNNKAVVNVDRTGLVQVIIHEFTNLSLETWKVDYTGNLIYQYSEQGQILDTLEIGINHPQDALGAIYLLRNSNLQVNDVINLTIIGHDSSGKYSAWKPARIKVKNLEKIKIQNKEVWCWKLGIKLSPEDNLFPGGNITLWTTTDERLIPVKVEADLCLFIFPYTVTGRLISKF